MRKKKNMLAKLINLIEMNRKSKLGLREKKDQIFPNRSIFNERMGKGKNGKD